MTMMTLLLWGILPLLQDVVEGIIVLSSSTTRTTAQHRHSPSSPSEEHHRTPFYADVEEWLTQEGIVFRRAENATIRRLCQADDADESFTMPTRLLELHVTDDGTATRRDDDTPRRMVALHLIPTPTCAAECLPPRLLKTWTDTVERQKKENHDDDDDDPSVIRRYGKLIHLHEDVWMHKPAIVRGRLLAQGVGRRRDDDRVRRVYARKTEVRRIPPREAVTFLDRHHLWGAVRARYAYGLFSKTTTAAADRDHSSSLLAVATFSGRRRVRRRGRDGGRLHRSHELLRLCCRRDAVVVGGLSRLIRAFCRDQRPDDLVTVVDRHWGAGGTGWYEAGFVRVAVMDPLVMAVRRPHHPASQPDPAAARRHLVGAGIRHPPPADQGNATAGDDITTTIDRRGLPVDLLERLNATSDATRARHVLRDAGYYPVYDPGVERFFMVVRDPASSGHQQEEEEDALDLWRNSQPSYPTRYYSDNAGIRALLEDARTPS